MDRWQQLPLEELCSECEEQGVGCEGDLQALEREELEVRLHLGGRIGTKALESLEFGGLCQARSASKWIGQAVKSMDILWLGCQANSPLCQGSCCGFGACCLYKHCNSHKQWHSVGSWTTSHQYTLNILCNEWVCAYIIYVCTSTCIQHAYHVLTVIVRDMTYKSIPPT